MVQNDVNTAGSSIISSQTVGNLHTVKLLTLAGVWEIGIVSNNPYSLKVVGRTLISTVKCYRIVEKVVK